MCPHHPAAFYLLLAAAPHASATDGTALAGRDYVAPSGTLTFVPCDTSKTILVPTLDDRLADPTKDFTVNLSNPTDRVISNGQAIGTILFPTKFDVVDGSASDNMCQYAVGGALGNSALARGDTTPRGVATTAAGTRPGPETSDRGSGGGSRQQPKRH